MTIKRSRALLAFPLPGDEVVISGIAGYFPKSNSVMELQENLFNKVDMLCEVNQSYEYSIKPKRMGKINNPNKFDQAFFDIHYTQAHWQNPMVRILLERTYEAIIDAGINPVELENTKTGVFVACTSSESEEMLLYDKVQGNMNGLIGSSEAMFALQVSKWLKVNGPAYKVDSACSSSMHALEQAYKLLREDHLDYAIVAGVQLNMLNYTGDFDLLCVLSEDGKCKSFDDSADGFIRSEAIVACFLQKAKTSRRIYAQILHSKTGSDGFKEEGLIHTSKKEQIRLLREFYEECSIPTPTIEYMECHATGTPVGDFQELGAVDVIMCSGRSDPLLIGSIRSNMGHTETAAALCSIAKLCIAYNTGYIPPNINFSKCRQDVPALTEGRLRVVTEKMPWNRGLVALNSFGFGGSNAHTVLKNIARNKERNGEPQDQLPRLVCVSGRTHNAVTRILYSFETKKLDVEEIRLWQAIHEHNIEKHGFRGYTLLESSSDVGVSLNKDIRRFSGVRRNVCFFYPDKGSECTGRVPHLMKIPAFTTTIEKCHEILKPKGINLINIVNSDGSGLNILYSSIRSVSIQIALTDLFKDVGIEPDYVTGHGVGEIVCAYADLCLTIEQAMLAAYYRAMACSEAFDIEQESASLYLGYKKTKLSDKETKYIATKVINNGLNGSNVKEMEDETLSSNIRDIGIKLLNNLKKIISSPKPHSKRWITAPVYTNQCEFPEPALCSAEYYAKNFTEPLSFTNTFQVIPTDCIQIEIAPQLKLKNIIQENQKKPVFNESLSEIGGNELEDFFKAFGELYLAGLTPRIANLYPHVPFPVTQGTPMLSHLVEWDHREEWFTDSVVINKQMCNSVERTVILSLEKEGYLKGNVIDGRILYPSSGFLVLVWETLARKIQKSYQDVSVIFENIRFERNIVLPTTGQLEFVINIHSITGEFEVSQNKITVVTGRGRVQYDVSQEFIENTEENLYDEESSNTTQYLQSSDIYNFLELKGCYLSNDFQRIIKCNIEGTYFQISWNDNWVIFLDSLLQTFNIKVDTNKFMLPTCIEKISIDVSTHYASLRALANPKIVDVYGEDYLNDVKSSGIEITGVDFTFIEKTPVQCAPVLETYIFFPFEENNPTKLENALRASIQLILENIQAYTFKAIEIIDDEYKKNLYEPLLNNVSSILEHQPLINAELTIISNELMEIPSSVIEGGIQLVNNNIAKYKNSLLVIGANLCDNLIALNQCWNILGEQGFVLSREPINFQKTKYVNNHNIISCINMETEYLVLLRKHNTVNVIKYIEMKTDEEYSWIDEIKMQLNEGGTFVVYAQDEYSGLIGFVNCLRKEPDGENVRGFWIKDTSAPPFNPNLDFYKEQLNKNFTINVYENGKWGSYCHLLLKDFDLPMPLDNAYLNVQTVGNLTSLKWTEGPLNINSVIEPESFLVNVYCASLNFRDVITAKTRITIDDPLLEGLNRQHGQGLEFVGRTASGTRVMGMAENALSNMVLANPNLLMAIPDEWSFEEAATVFVAYFTAYAALIEYGKLQFGESVLIHTGSDDIGQAAINISLSYGCNIFITVDSAEKRAMIRKLFPKIKDSHISFSGDSSFEEMIQREKKGQGVDVILNSLSGEQLLSSARCLGYRGRFLNIGQFDNMKNTSIEMYFYQNEITFHGVTLEHIHQERFAGIRQRILDLMIRGIASGTVQPLTYCVFEKDEVISAYSYMTTEKPIGKVIIKLRDEEPSRSESNITPIKMEGIRRYSCDPNKVYILVGGLGGIGLELTEWLTLRGAKKLVLVTRRGITSGYQAFKIRKWKLLGIDVAISTLDITKESGCKEMLEIANSMGHVEAIFNVAMVPRNLTFQHQTRDTMHTACAPKASVTINLDKLTRTLCPNLRDFVVFSSYICRGNAGQTNYGLANSIMERVCEKRKRDGLRALAIQWGTIGDVGYVKRETLEQIKHVLIEQSIDSCLYILDKFLKQNEVVASSYLPSKQKIEQKTETNAQIQLNAIANIMGIKDLKTISHQMTLAELGMDSIVAVELKNMLERNYEIFLGAKETRALTFARLEELLESKQTSVNTDTHESIKEVSLILRIFMKQFGDENLACKPFVFMPTSVMGRNDIDQVRHNSESTLFIVPGPGGCAKTFASLCQELKTKACVLQLGLDHLDEGVSSMVDRLYENLKVQLNPNAPFNLLGYSYGTVLVLELAARLEREGLKGTVYCIDSSPFWCKILLTTEAPDHDAIKLQNDLIGCVIDFAMPGKTASIMANIEKIKTFDGKIDAALQNLSDNSNYSKEYLKRTTLAYYNQVVALRSYNIDCTWKLDSQIVLIRNEDDIFISLSESYGLEKNSNNDVVVQSIKSDHISIVECDNCVKIINKYLSIKNNVSK